MTAPAQPTLEESAAPVPRFRAPEAPDTIIRQRRRRPYRNVPEQECAEMLAKQGVSASRHGYPDFWFLDENGKLAYVEVKPDGKDLKASQWAFLGAAARSGCRAFTFRPEEGIREVTNALGGGIKLPAEGDWSVMRKGGMCFVCQDYIPPGTPMKTLAFCPMHYFRHRGCEVQLGGVSPQTPPEKSRVERRGRACTCRVPGTTRARAVVAQRHFRPDPYGVDVLARIDLEGEGLPPRLDISFRMSGEKVNGAEVLRAVLARLGVDP